MRNKEFWRNVTEEELEEVREDLDKFDEDVFEEYDAEDIRELASRKPSSYAKSRHCSNCGFKWRIKMDFGSKCRVCGSVSFG